MIHTPLDAPAAEAASGSSTPRGRGRVVTFYSHKGGVGRSMALANVAALLARAERRVLLLDWDLEAPGLHKYFERAPSSLDPDPMRTPGVLDLLLSARDTTPLDWRSCVVKARPFGDGVSLDLIAAGAEDLPTRGTYAQALQQLDWNALFAEHDVGGVLEGLREQWIANYDFILVDSRTGISDIGGVCTILLPDLLVTLFTSNEQSLVGARRASERAVEMQRELPYPRQRLRVVPLPSRDESSREYDSTEKWRARYTQEWKRAYADWVPVGIPLDRVVRRLYIPYVAKWSFGERLPVAEAAMEVVDPASVSAAYARLASLLDHDLDWTAVDEGAARVHEQAQVASTPVAVAAEPARRSWAGRILTGLMAAALVVAAGLQAWRQQQDEQAIARLRSGAGSSSSAADLRRLVARGMRDFADVQLRGADLSDLDLRSVDLSRADLALARLDRAILDSAILTDSDLRSASLVGASLRYADLAGVRFDSAVLTGADLYGAHVPGAELTVDVISSERTILPDSSVGPLVADEDQPSTVADVRASSDSGWVWIGNFDRAGGRWSRPKLVGLDGKPLSADPATIVAGARYRVDGNLIARAMLPPNDREYFRDVPSLGVLARRSVVELLREPAGRQRDHAMQYWASVRVVCDASREDCARPRFRVVIFDSGNGVAQAVLDTLRALGHDVRREATRLPQDVSNLRCYHPSDCDLVRPELDRFRALFGAVELAPQSPRHPPGTLHLYLRSAAEAKPLQSPVQRGARAP